MYTGILLVVLMKTSVLKQEIQKPNLIIHAIHYNGYYNIKQLHVFKTTENTAK